MKKKIILFIITVTLSVPSFVAAQYFSTGASFGLFSVGNNSGIDGNLFVAYQFNDNIAVGVDALLGRGKSGLKTNAYMVYVEGGNPTWGIDKRNIVYFSGILGLGRLEQKVNTYRKDVLSFYAGTKVNVNLNPKFVFGLKSGVYLSKLDRNPVMANLFFTYKFL